MFGSSGPAETAAVQAAAASFTRTSGIKVKVIAASNLTQQLAQGFAGGQPPDVP
jgi:multiple sugar transport system substrate-binding protein